MVMDDPGCQGPGTKVDSSNQRSLLCHESRRAILELLECRPGLNRHQLSVILDIHPESIEFHVEKLEQGGLVETRPDATNPREEVCFTKKNVHLWDNEPTRVLFGRGLPVRVAAYLTEHPSANVAAISEALGLPVPTVRRHLHMLEEAELVEHIRLYEGRIYQAKPELTEWVERFGLREA